MQSINEVLNQSEGIIVGQTIRRKHNAMSVPCASLREISDPTPLECIARPLVANGFTCPAFQVGRLAMPELLTV